KAKHMLPEQRIGDFPTSMAWSADSQRLRILHRDWQIIDWDLASNTQSKRNNSLKLLAWSPEGPQLASGHSDGTVKIWEWETGKEPKNLKGHTGEIVSLTWSLDGKRLVSLDDEGVIRIWNPGAAEQIAIFAPHPVARGGPLIWSPNGRRLA